MSVFIGACVLVLAIFVCLVYVLIHSMFLYLSLLLRLQMSCLSLHLFTFVFLSWNLTALPRVSLVYWLINIAGLHQLCLQSLYFASTRLISWNKTLILFQVFMLCKAYTKCLLAALVLIYNTDIKIGIIVIMQLQYYQQVHFIYFILKFY